MSKASADASSSMCSSLGVGFGADRSIWGNAVSDGRLNERQTVAPKDGEVTRTKVLIVDDEHIIANTLSMILNNSGFEARAVYSGEAAVKALGSFQPDVMISDVFMTGMSGVETAIVFRMQRPNCKILLFSGQAATADLLHRARDQGYQFDILAKPVHPSDLLKKLRADSVARNTPFDS